VALLVAAAIDLAGWRRRSIWPGGGGGARRSGVAISLGDLIFAGVPALGWGLSGGGSRAGAQRVDHRGVVGSDAE
jgi:hypothetical protein